jgi:hypothetical protein
MLVPAVCDNCGAFFSSGIDVSNSFHITFSNCTAGPCPKCGASGHIPDGVYNFIGNTIEILSCPSRTILELDRLAKILKKAKEEHASLKEVKETIEEELPELSSIKDLLPRSRVQLYAFITIIIMVIQIIIGQLNKNQVPNITINQVFSMLYEENASQGDTGLIKKDKIISPKYSERKRKKIGRNDPCPCGSGKKYKKCCLGKRK